MGFNKHSLLKLKDNPMLAMSTLFMGAFMISFSGVWVKTSQVTPASSAFYRVFFGGIILLLLTLFNRELKWYGLKHIALLFLCGLIFALDLFFYHSTIERIGPGLGTILPNFQVIILTCAGIFFFKENLQKSFLFSIPIAFAGLYMIVGFDWDSLPKLYQIGVLMGILTAFFYAFFLLSLRKLQAGMENSSIFYVLMLVSLATAFFLAVEMILTEETFKIPTIQSFLALGSLGLFSQAAGWILITNALPHVRTSYSGIILLLQPALAFVWDVLFFQRSTTLINWAGVLLALFAIYIATIGKASVKS
ncbi:MAG: DMT family transporter [Desulfobacula sp.]|jgi:drug/metabolite transporter (DMT)-like permease|nr:DMT family transporter [Desulfobacula sp.]